MSSAPAAATDLPANDHTMFTNYMGDCVSTIVLFNRVGAMYTNVRGFHAAGGIENTNWASLFYQVPNNVMTMVYVISGTGNFTQYRQSQIRDIIRAEANNYNLTNVSIMVYHGRSSATIDRFGQVT